MAPGCAWSRGRSPNGWVTPAAEAGEARPDTAGYGIHGRLDVAFVGASAKAGRTVSSRDPDRPMSKKQRRPSRPASSALPGVRRHLRSIRSGGLGRSALFYFVVVVVVERLLGWLLASAAIVDGWGSGEGLQGGERWDVRLHDEREGDAMSVGWSERRTCCRIRPDHPGARRLLGATTARRSSAASPPPLEGRVGVNTSASVRLPWSDSSRREVEILFP